MANYFSYHIAKKTKIKWIIFAISSFAILSRKKSLLLQMDSFSWIGQQSISTTKKETLFLLSSTKTLPTHEKKKKKLFRSCKMEKKPSNNGKKTKLFHSRKTTNLFFSSNKVCF